MDFILILIALSVATVVKRVMRGLAANEARRRRQIAALPLVRIADAAPGERVRIVGTVARISLERGGAFVVGDGSGATALVYGGSAAALLRDGGDGDAAAIVVGDHVTIAGVARPPEPALDHAGGHVTGHAAGRADWRALADGARLVFAGAEAHPLLVVRGAR